MGKYKVLGLSKEVVERSRAEHGSNELEQPEVESFWDKLKENFEDPLIKILCVALGITLVLSFFGYAEWFEGIGIAAAVFIATFVSTWSEFKNESSFRDLQVAASRVKNNVFRDGSSVVKIFASEIVVGDFVLLQAGDKVPADGRLVFGEVHTNQASLTGENEAVKKTVAPDEYAPHDPSDLGDQYLLFRGSVVDEGEGVMLVDTVGTSTYYGRLSKELVETEQRESPLQVKLSHLADQISFAGYCGATFIAVAFLFKQFVMDQGYDLDRTLAYVKNWEVALNDSVTALILAIIVIVVAVPEGLPMMIAIVLSLNMRKLLKSNVLVRRLLGIETAGSLNILFVDKTGTITKGVFRPQVFATGNSRSYETFELVPKKLRDILAFTLRESTASVISEGGHIVGGNSSDQALLSFLNKDALLEKSNVTVVREVLFSSVHKYSASQVEGSGIPAGMLAKGTQALTLVKGAAEVLLEYCTHYYDENGVRIPMDDTSALTAEIDQLSNTGTRVIAVATYNEPLSSTTGEDDLIVKQATLPRSMTLVGVVGVHDEIRAESPKALGLAQKAGIQVVMITGDRKETAMSVAKQIGLLKADSLVLTSDQLQRMSDEKLQEMLPKMVVVARALPTDKSRLVTLAQQLGMVAGMTGDGVNDSSALKKADVGFAMGSGSEVAKEAADIVVLDNNFLSIAQAILYGRTIFKSIRKFIVFQSTVNCASMLIAFLGPFIGYDFPLTLTQLLWVNLVMDTLAAIAFGGEAALPRFMEEKPIQRDQHIINGSMWSSILTNGFFITALCYIFLTHDAVASLFIRDGVANRDVYLTAFFCFFIFLTNFNAFNVRTPTVDLFENLFENTGFVFVVSLIFVVQIVFSYVGGRILRTVPLTFNEWQLVIGAASVIIPFDLLRKLIFNSILPAH